MRRHSSNPYRALLATGVIVASLAAAPGAQASKALIGTFGTPAGEGAGQLDQAKGIAVNRTGAGGVSPGDVYVVDSGNNRIQEFSASGAFVRAFGYDVVASGPDNTGANEQQSLTVDATGGTFALAVTRRTLVDITEGSNAITHLYAPDSAFHVGDTVQGPFPPGTTIAAVGADSLILSAGATITFPDAEFKATETTGPVPYNTTSAGLEAALEALPVIGSGNVAVTGGPGSSAPLTIEYKGALGHNDFAHPPEDADGADNVIAPISTALSGATQTATIATTVRGGGREVCNAVSSPADVCKDGSRSAAAGGMSGPQGVAIDQNTGSVYVTDFSSGHSSQNDRIDVFSATGAFELSFGYDVVASGPDNLAPVIRNEQQTIETGSGTGGTFTLTFNGQTTAALPYNASAATLKAALEGLSSIGAGNVEVSGPPGGPGLLTVEFIGALAGVDVPEMVLDNSGLNGFGGSFSFAVETIVAGGPNPVFELCKASAGDVCQAGQSGGEAGQLSKNTTGEVSLPAVGPNGHLYVPDSGNLRLDEFAPTVNGSGEVTAVGFVKALGWDVVRSGPDNVPAVDAVQRLTIPPTVNGGTFTLSFGGQTTKALPYNVPAFTLTNALHELSSLGSDGQINAVAKGGGVMELVFGGELEDVPVKPITVDSSKLAGGEATTAVIAEGVSPYEQCDVAVHPTDACKAGLEGRHLGQFEEGNPSSVAVDSSGAIYTVDEGSGTTCGGSCRVLKFDPSGKSSEEFAPEQLTVEGEANALRPTDVVVDPTDDHVLVAKKEGVQGFKFLEFDSSGALLDQSPGEGATLDTTPTGSNFEHGLAMGTNGRFYFVNALGMVDVFGPPPAPTVSIAPVTGAGSTTATFHGTVTPPAPVEGAHFDTTYHFEYSTNGFAWSRFPAGDVDVGNGSGAGSPTTCPVGNPPTCTVEQTATGLQPGVSFQVRLVATTGTAAISETVSFETGAAAPSVSGTVAEEVSQSSARLVGFVNPNNDATSYHFEWGTTTGYGTRIPVDFDPLAGSGGKAVKVSANISGLKAGDVYHFRLVASNSSGVTDGADQEFVALDASGLPDGRVPEQVSPDKRPVGTIEQVGQGQITAQPSLDGNSTIYPVLNGLAEATAGGNVSYMAERGSKGWTSTQISVPSLVPVPNPGHVGADQTGKVLYYAPDLSCGALSSFEPLTPDTPTGDIEKGIYNLYRRAADGTYTLLSPPVPLNAEALKDPGGDPNNVDGASSDCGHVLFDSAYRLESEAPQATGEQQHALYEWANGELRLPGRLPDGSVASNAIAGQASGESDYVNSISPDGSRVFFSAKSDEGGDNGKTAVFVRVEGTNTVDVSQSKTAIANNGESIYQMASEDGSHVFFTARYGLASNATSTGGSGCSSSGGCDLYSYDVAAETLTDLSADTNPADKNGAGVVSVLDASKDGSYVYFAAHGQLVPEEGNTEAKNLLGAGSYNVYLSHGGALSYVGLIGQADLMGEEGGDSVSSRKGWVADVTPDGSRLLFVSHEDVTGYVSGGVREAYLYSATTGKTVCVSCRMDGQPATRGVAGRDVETIASEHQGESSDGSEVMWVKPRSLSVDGSRVFFKSYDALAPGAVKGRRNLYEWENGQVYVLLGGEEVAGPEPSEYLGSSASGDDVFLKSDLKLASTDFDNTTDVYDLRAPHTPGETVGFPSPPPPPPPCDPLAEECQGAASPQPGVDAGSASESFSGPGNLSLPPPVAKQPAHKKKPVHKKTVHKKAAHKKKPVHKKTARKSAHRRAAIKRGRAAR